MSRTFSVARMIAVLSALGSLSLYACTTTNVYVVGEDGGRSATQTPTTSSTSTSPLGNPDASTSTKDASSDAVSDAGTDAETTKDGGGDSAVDSGKPWVGPACARSKPSTAQFKWSLPHDLPACNALDMKFITEELVKGASYRSIETRLFNQTCASCVFSELADGSWGPIVFTTPGGSTGFKNFGGCYIDQGKTPTCGQDYAKLDYCWRGVCDQCATQQELNTCLQRSSTEADGPCYAEYNAASTSCGGLAPVAGCTDLFEAIQTMCGQ